MKKKSICLKEEQLREFVSYSVKRLLKEALSRPIDGSHGTFGGWEIGKYGHDSMEISFDPTDNDKMAQALEDMLEDGNFNGLTPEMFMEGGQFSNIWPVNVRIDYEINQGGKGNGYDTPDDPDEAVVKDWYADTSKLGEIKPFVDALIKSYIEDGYFDEEEIWENEHNNLYEDKASSIHFDGKSSFKEANPYEDMTWDEYCQKKAGEKKEEEGKKPWWEKDEGEPKNKGVTVHFGNDDLKEAIRKAVTNIFEGIGGNEEEAQSQFPAKASGTFTEKYGQKGVKCKAYVENNNGTVTMAILMYGDMGWEPEMEWMFDVEEYTNGTWLPYWETLGGDSSMKSLSRFWPKFVKLLTKIGYLADEDDETPFL